MATTIITKYGVSPGIPPLPSELAVGEVAVNHGDGQIYTKKADGTVIPIGGGGDPGDLPVGVDGNTLFNSGGTWAVSQDVFLADNPDKPGQRELQLLNKRQLTQYFGADDTEPAVELIGDTLDEAGLRVFQPTNTGVFGIELECDSGNSSSLLMRQPGTTTQGILLQTGGNDASIISVDGPVVSTGGTSQFAGITMSGTNAGINMQNIHRVFNHPDPTTATSTNVANARWVNNNYLSNTDSTVVKTNTTQTISGSKTFTNAVIKMQLPGSGSRFPVVWTGGSAPYTLQGGNYTIPTALSVKTAFEQLLAAITNAGVTLTAPDLAAVNAAIIAVDN
jgi:hypothetical protein